MGSRKSLSLKIITTHLAMQDPKCVDSGEIRSGNASNTRKSTIYRGSTHQNSFPGTLESPNVAKMAITFTAITLETAKCSQTLFTRMQCRCLSTFPARVNSISAATFRTTLHSSALYVACNLLLLLLYDGYINYITGTEDGIFKTRYR
jgi:hypothetical protein